MARRKLVPRTRNHGTLTEAGFKQWIIEALRKKSGYWKPAQACKKAARLPDKMVNPATGKLCFASKCAACGKACLEKEVQIDHIEPVVDPHEGFVGWDKYIERMYPEVDGFQALCPDCHKEKTDRERDIATERKRREKAASKD